MIIDYMRVAVMAEAAGLSAGQKQRGGVSHPELAVFLWGR